MTKSERLAELKAWDGLEKVLDKYFDAGWKNFIKDVRSKNDISNVRMFKILCLIKGSEFTADLADFMKKTGHKHALLELTTEPKGILMKDSRYPTIPELMIEKYPSGNYKKGAVYIHIKQNRWVTFVF